VLPLNSKNKKISIPPITYFLILSVIIHLLLLLNISNVNNKVQISQNTINLYIEKRVLMKVLIKIKKNQLKEALIKMSLKKLHKKQIDKDNKNNSKNNRVGEEARKKVYIVKEKTPNLDNREKRIDESKLDKTKSEVLKEKINQKQNQRKVRFIRKNQMRSKVKKKV